MRQKSIVRFMRGAATDFKLPDNIAKGNYVAYFGHGRFLILEYLIMSEREQESGLLLIFDKIIFLRKIHTSEQPPEFVTRAHLLRKFV